MSNTTSQLKQLIYYHLDNNLLKNALFLAQRLAAHEGSRNPDAAHLLAYTQLQCGFMKAAWDTTRAFMTRGGHLGCAYVFAQACLETGKYVDGIHALEKTRSLWHNRCTFSQHSESRRQILPDAASVLCLQGKLWKAHKNDEEAVQCWVQSLHLNPFMWDAYTLLVEAGTEDISIPAIYTLNSEMVDAVHAQYAAQEQQPKLQPVPRNLLSQPSVESSLPDPFTSVVRPGTQPNALFEKFNSNKLNINTVNTIHDDETLPTPSTVLDFDEAVQQTNGVSRADSVPPAPLRKVKTKFDLPPDPSNLKMKSASSRLKARLRPTSEEPTSEQLAPSNLPPKRTVSGAPAPGITAEPVRRTTRSQTSKPPSVAAPSKVSSMVNSLGLRQERDIKKAKAPAIKPRTATAATVGRAVSGNRVKPATSVEPPDHESTENRAPNAGTMPPQMPVDSGLSLQARADKDIDAIRGLLELFNLIAEGYYHLHHFDCEQAIRIYDSLPAHHRETPYILAQIARAYNEMSRHADAEKYFIRVRQLAPSRLEDMEIYSTVLYQLKSEIELAYLAHELVGIERNSPQTWIAIGNSFSLQREHEQALRCFKRATQLDPTFAYAYTLQGHEHIENEEFPKALQAYRSAIAADKRHYNAWYGMGKTYAKLGKYDNAELYYCHAADINPSNAVLTCAIGTVMEKTKSVREALVYYEKACRLAPRSALARFKKARALMGSNQPEEALKELDILKEIAPDEANVWFLSGRLCKMIGRRGDAVKAFTTALQLDPKAAQYIKDAMENLDEDDEYDGDGDEDMD